MNVHCKPADSFVGATGGILAVDRSFDRDASVGAEALAGFREATLDLAGTDFMVASQWLAEAENPQGGMHPSLTAEMRYENSETKDANRSSSPLKFLQEECRQLATRD
jgi:hypothetical protein